MADVIEVEARDSEGNRATIRSVGSRVSTASKDDPFSSVPGLATLSVVETGERVNRIEKGLYREVHWGREWRSEDPRAP